MNINGRMHHPDCASGMGFGTDDCWACHSILCAGCDKEIPIEKWPQHQIVHALNFCGDRGGPTPCRLLKGHPGIHVSALRLAGWASEEPSVIPQA